MLVTAVSFNKIYFEKSAVCLELSTKQSVVKCEEQMKTLSFSCSDTSLKINFSHTFFNAQIIRKAVHSFWRLSLFTEQHLNLRANSTS